MLSCLSFLLMLHNKFFNNQQDPQQPSYQAAENQENNDHFPQIMKIIRISNFTCYKLVALYFQSPYIWQNLLI
ncbi:hypothetical protein Fmac_008292 [Flemingia macrophylla]|uniref:Uncharacterized protein n=1 Tax=Flemingia macrophylla TaxID=520843 RepID=A0ABD1MXV6_9FABA